MKNQENLKYWLLIIVGVFYFVLIYSYRWVSSDGLAVVYQTKNVLNGLGMVWNYGERSFVSTSPLYSLVSIPLIFILEQIGLKRLPLQNIPITINILFSMMAFGLILKFIWKKNLPWKKFYISIGTLLLAFCSEFFIHFSTSALENSLSYLVLTFFGITIYSDKISLEKNLLPFSIALVFLTRYDFFLIIFPTVIYLFWKYKLKSLIPALTMGIPIILWFAFAFFYFGSIFPNSFYMKSGFLGIDNSLGYLVKNTVRAPFLALLIGGGIIAAYKTRKTIFWGMIAYLVYTIYVTDYMFGRFWSNLVPLSIIALLQYISQYNRKLTLKEDFPFALCFLFIAVCFVEIEKYKNAILLFNERKFYTTTYNLMREDLQYKKPFNNNIEKCDGIDARGADALHIPLTAKARKKNYIYVDIMGLATPFTTYYGKNYGIKGDRPGHLKINIDQLNSKGYEKSLFLNKNIIMDKGTYLLFNDIELITKGNLFSKARFNAIIRLHTIKYNEIK